MSCPVSGQRKRPACRMAGGTGVERHAAAAACDGKGNTRRRAMPQFVAGSGLPVGRAGSPRKTKPDAGPGPSNAAPGAADSLPFALKKTPQAQPASLRRTASRAVSRLPNWSTRGP